MSLTTVTKKLGKHYRDKHNSEAALQREREKFFNEVSKEVAKGPLAQKVVKAPEVGDIPEWVHVYHPGWLLVEERPEEGTLLLEEDPSLIKYIFVNHQDGQVYQRNAVQGAPSLDDEALAEEHPEVWKRVTHPAYEEWVEFVYDFAAYADVPRYKVESYVGSKDFPRELCPLEDIDHEDLEIISNYMVPGPISLRLEKPRKAKAEELSSE